ncbi:MAG TPA: hypothetical protein QF753_18670, partial [Victivallales bacterium]|nr:hypothetical protein [Victivallales bacterium]
MRTIIMGMLVLVTILTFNSAAFAAPEIFVFLGGGPANENLEFINHPEISGAQIIYPWKVLERKKGVYNFQAIKDDLAFLKKYNKKLFIQIQDRSFTIENIPVPDYLLTDEYDGGVMKQQDFAGEGKPTGYGWAAKQWDPKVQERFQKLLTELGKEFDGKIAGVNLPETSIDFDPKKENIKIDDKYYQGVLSNLAALKQAFKKSYAVQYVNFFPGEWNNDQKYMEGIFNYAVKNDIGLGNPDTVPYRKAQMKNSYPFFNKYKDKLRVISIAVQEPDYTYTNPKTGKKFTVEEIYDFAVN